MQLINLFAEKFYDAFYEKEWRGGFEPNVSLLSIAEAYNVQDLVAEMRIDRGEVVVGFKIGCTSNAIRSQFGLQEPIYGRLFDPHVQKQGIAINWKDYVNCAIEPEMVITIGSDLCGVGISDDQILDAIESVSPGIEIHNFRFWFTPPTSQELICSGGIHAGLIVGSVGVSPRELSFKSEIFSVFKDGKRITKAPASEVMGGPIHSLRWLVDCLTKKGAYLKKGSLVIPGSPVELVSIDSDTELKIEIDCVGALVANFKERKNEPGSGTDNEKNRSPNRSVGERITDGD
jgi:2-keto-4-pentenoate hydratase